MEWAVRTPGPQDAGKLLGGNAPEGAFWRVPPGVQFSRLYLGNEFCEFRIPTLPELHRTLEFAVPLTLLTPLVCDRGLDKLRKLFQALPKGSEVVCSDWGVLRELRADFQELVPVLGRTLIRALKEPRVPVGSGPTLKQTDLALPGFVGMLKSQGVSRVEIDLPPARLGMDLRPLGLSGSLHLPFGHVAWGRACMVGSLHLPYERKFEPGAPCRQECRGLLAELHPPAGSPALPARLFHRGNTAFALHPEADLENSVELAGECGIDRLVYDPEVSF